MRIGIFVIVLTVLGCSGQALQVPERAQIAIQALRASNFDEAQRQAEEILQAHPQDAQTRVVRAIVRYKQFGHDLSTDLRTLAGGLFVARAINTDYFDFALKRANDSLTQVETDLAAAARYADFSLQLCLACWEVDWNRSGRVDERDRRLFEVEYAADGQRIPDGDPRRRPEFHFDIGDIHWARAMVAFQQATVNLLWAYDFSELSELATLFGGGRDELPIITLRLRDADKIHRVRELLLRGLDEADASRRAYLAETDDLQEWVPNPRQKSHPLPLPVDNVLYETWEGVIGDIRRMIEGQEGISVTEAAQLGDHVWADPPQGFINLEHLFDHPANIVLDFRHLENLDHDRSRADVERVLHDIFGAGYQPQMRPTTLLSRMSRMRTEVERGEESLERKLRYLLWLN